MGKRIGSRDAAKILRISRTTIERWRSGGVGPAFKIENGRATYDREDVINYARTGDMRPTIEIAKSGIGRELYEEMIRRGLDMDSVARQLGVCKQTVQGWMQGRRPAPERLSRIRRWMESPSQELVSTRVSLEMKERLDVAAWYLRATADELVYVAIEQIIKDVESTIDRRSAQ